MIYSSNTEMKKRLLLVCWFEKKPSTFYYPGNFGEVKKRNFSEKT
jgi:hypothetical protein